jgi:hypothetical protein
LGTTLLLFVFIFSSASQATGALYFGDGLPLQQVDPGGRNSVQFVAYYDTPLSATLQLYALSPGQFITTYNSLTTNQWSGVHLDPSGLPLVAEWQETVTATYQWQKATLPGVPAGFYMLTLADGAEIQDEMLVVLSRDALALKASASGDEVQVVAWASRLASGEPLPGATVTVYDDQGQPLASGLTGPDGVYSAELTGADPENLVAIAALEGELTACGTRQEWQTDYATVASAAPHKVYLYTDRPIYRPGHTVHYKGILRHDDDGAYTPLESTQLLTLSVRDARDNVLATLNPSASSFGVISGSFTLADETGLGEYNLELLLDGHTYRQPFKVEEYRKPDYAVNVSAPASFYIWGDDIPVAVASEYYFGQPVAGAAVEFSLYRQSGYYGYDELVWQTTGLTDEQGHWSTLVHTSDYHSTDATYVLQATVSDASNQSVSGEVRVPVYYAEYSLSTSLERYGYEPNEDIDVALFAQAHDGSPVAGATLTVTARTWVYDSGYQEVVRVLGVTDQSGQAVVTFQAPQSGWYELQAQGQDGRGRLVTVESWFWVYYPGWDWYGDTDDELTISADKASYAPGDVAQLLVRSPVSGTALLSLERGHTRLAYPVSLTDTVTLLTLPIQSDYAPNVFVTLAIFQRNQEPDDAYYHSAPEGHLRLGSVELHVPVTDRALQIELTPDRTTYRPGETVTFTLQTRDQAGEPVQAHVSLALVDEAIYALSEDLSADIHETFYGRRDNGVVSYDSLRPTRSPGYYDYYPNPGGTATPPASTATPEPDVGAGTSEDDSVRRDFPDTAYWNPGILTDEQGRAVVALTLPDNLTRWRALARAVSTDTLVGEATSAITVTQELLVRPALPRFLVQGDLVQLRAVAHNYLAHEVTATMQVSASGLALLGADCGFSLCLPPTMTLPPGGQVAANWPAVASELGEGQVLARLDVGGGTALPLSGDAVELPLPVYPFAVPEVINRVGQVEHEITETFYLSVTALPGASSLRVRLSSSIALGLLDGLEYLIGYPYG